ncbi:ABC transporter permease [Fulvivirga maritima]|uniref:ABC transporter permease n=1 Tax=Fulvivirga maritima TaxID=2904247 RepID=UPI001F18A421|nr:ABC transporter permease [Fulvivirga maritima]UII27576.1 ABC transporter permease [Fulvivirga maritima]
MILNFFKIAFRNLKKNKGYTFINVGGFAVGMSIAILVGIWVYDELSFNKDHTNYDRIGRLMHHVNFNGERMSLIYMPYLIGDEIENTFSEDFKYIVMSTLESEHVLKHEGDRKFKFVGAFMEEDAPILLDLNMVEGNQQGLSDPSSILIAKSIAIAIFGNEGALGKFLEIDNKLRVKVTGVYEDFTANSDFEHLKFVAPWKLYLNNEPSVREHASPWQYNNFQTFVQLDDNASFANTSDKIAEVIHDKLPADEANRFKKQVFIHPMSKWHLYSEFKNGKNTGGRIEYVRLFGIIGLFVLLMACINFMNLSTARSEKRAKEVGVRKTMGSPKYQLIIQFFIEAFVISFIAFIIALPIVVLILPFFNDLADKSMELPWKSIGFWVLGSVFCLITGVLAGSYPALYLSSFNPVSVLKGTFKAGKYSAIPRKILVILQFSISIILIIGTIVVFRQVEFARNKPIGYQKDGLVVFNTTDLIHNSFESFRIELLKSGMIEEVAESANSTTDYYVSDGDISWEGKDPDLALEFPINNVTPEYGNTIGWSITEGRDFSRDRESDHQSFILNEAAVKFMQLEEPVGTNVMWKGKSFQVIGVVDDIVFESPYKPVRPSIFQMTGDRYYLITARVTPEVSSSEAINYIRSSFQTYDPTVPFDFKFVDQEYDKKFRYEERVGKLATFFAALAILISCLGIYGLSAFMAEQRIKEIGIRKVLGAPVFNLWALLSKDFAMLLITSMIFAIPFAYYFMNNWLQNYQYRTNLSFWIFLVAAIGAMVITLITISYHSLKAAMSNPIKSLKSE